MGCSEHTLQLYTLLHLLPTDWNIDACINIDENRYRGDFLGLKKYYLLLTFKSIFISHFIASTFKGRCFESYEEWLIFMIPKENHLTMI